tara:strand:+ start:5533 stop:5772 length:240 start_codon:yes stop_codon:yes gene_type:complete
MITEVEMKKLKTHSKKHKGGMESEHIKNMIKIMKKNNTSFIAAHKKAVQIDKKKEENKKKGMIISKNMNKKNKAQPKSY